MFFVLQNFTAPENFTEYNTLSAAETSKGGARFILGKYFLRQFFFFISMQLYSIYITETKGNWGGTQRYDHLVATANLFWSYQGNEM